MTQGGCGLHRVDVYLNDTVGGYVTKDIICMSHARMTMKIIRELPRNSDSEDNKIDYDNDEGGNSDPFNTGGAFNDPMFDAQYSEAFFEMRG